MQKVGTHVACQHYEVATGGQSEIDMRFSWLVELADNLPWFNSVATNLANRNG